MPKNVSSLKGMVEECLNKLVKSYKECEEDFLTESDAVASLFCILKDEMKKENVEGFGVHAELRPYIEEEKGTPLVLMMPSSNRWEWKNQTQEQYGARVDIVILNCGQDYFERAKEKLQKKYSRYMSYPLDAFAVCIEVKIRVSGNTIGIEKDIDKLCKIRETNKSCLVYLVVVDRKAPDKEREGIKNYCHENGVPLYIAFPSKQTYL